AGQEIVKAAQWAASDWNLSGQDEGHELVIVPFYDNNDVEQAKTVAQQIVDDGRFIGVVGHELSRTSEVAGPIYASAGIPVITPSATGDAVTATNPWYFRTVFDNTTQGEGIAAYSRTVLNAPAAIIVSSQDPYGVSLRNGFVSAYKPNGTIQADIVINDDPATLDAQLAVAAAQINKIAKPGPIVLAGLNPELGGIATKLTGAAAKSTLVGSDALSEAKFYLSMRAAGVDEVNRAINATPIVRGQLTGAGTSFYNQFEGVHGYHPGWMAATTYDAVDAFAHSISRTEVAASTQSLEQDRVAVRDVLALARTPETAIPVLTGPLYFNDTRSAVKPVAFVSGRIEANGTFDIEPAPLQLAPYSQSAGMTLEQAIAAGRVVAFNNQVFTIQRIVMVGMNFNQVGELDLASQSFSADFFVWFRYEGGAQLPFTPEFTNAVDPGLELGDPQKLSQSFGQTYALYRVSSDFKGQFAFNDFPFDTQQLPIVLQPSDAPSSQVSFVVDAAVLSEQQEQRLASGVNPAESIDRIPNWQASAVDYFTASIGTTASMGDPTAVVGTTGITYSEFVGDVAIGRDIPSFLTKNLLPLLLLVSVSYIALWLPFKESGARISFGTAGILTGAVMLSTVTNSLPQVDYTVAIEWAYYAFIFLSGCSVLVSMVGRQLVDRRQLAGARALERSSRIAYPIAVAAVAFGYWLAFH
ncbi:MAG: ABC transporter substrate-binding protein, partial [Candidatus Nanopelagicales bacterium]